MRNPISLIFLLFITFVAFGQNPERIYQKHSFDGEKLRLQVNDGEYVIQFYNKNIVETSFFPNGQNNVTGSHAVVLQQKNIDLVLSEDQDKISFGTEDITVQVNFSPFQISYLKNGQDIISEKRGYYRSVHQPLESVKGNIIADFTDKIEFNLNTDEMLYGSGARALGMNRRGYRLPLFNRAHYGYETHSELMNFTMPIVLSSQQYLIHFDNSVTGYIDLDSQKNNTLTYETISGRKTYQIVVGDSWENIIENYTLLTGKQPMLPRWALGNFASRFGYHSQDEVISTVKKFREKQIPVDAAILDLYWFGKEIKGTMGNLAFDRDSFPEPKKMIHELKDLDTETILITEPFILSTSTRWEEAVNKDILGKDTSGNPYQFEFYFGNTGLIDIYSENGFNWFHDIYKSLFDIGVTGIWGDLGEPEVHPHDMIHATGNGQEVHNIYGHDWSKLVQEASMNALPNQRPFILMRAGYSGSQRYGMIPWSGDVNRTWGGLQKQPEIALQMGMQGMSWMHSDLGGFAGANEDDELYTRWLQYGVFQPVYRPHAQEDVPSEPVFRSEKAQRLAKKAIELRYQMLPYNYHLMYLNHAYGTPLMKPLFFEEPNNKSLWDYDKAYLWGNDFLIAPIKESNQKIIDVYFPNTADWIDFYTHDIYKGGKNYPIQTKEEYIPTFLRLGSIIPMTPLVQSTKDYDGTKLILKAFLTENRKLNTTEIYHDDGKSIYPIKDENYEITLITSEQKSNAIRIKFNSKKGKNYTSKPKNIVLDIMNMNKNPTYVKFHNIKYPVDWHKDATTLRLQMSWNPKYSKIIEVIY